ncbi:MAG: glycosyltransferase [Oligoflexia bacterium]|nr:glycosyltransferase [Oligoflexia bacterium]
MRTLFIETGSTGEGGSFHSLKQLVDSFPEYKSSFFTLYLTEPKVTPEIPKENILISHSNTLQNYSYFLFLRFFPFLKRFIYQIFHYKLYKKIDQIIKENKIECIYCNNQPARDDFIIERYKNRAIKIISHIRTLNTPSYQLNLSDSDLVNYISVSEAVKHHWLEYGIKKIDVIHNFVNAKPVSIKKNASPTFCFVGRLIEGKGVEKLPLIFKIIQKQLPEATFYILGDGELKNDLQRSLDQNGIKNYELFGFINNQLEIMSKCHILIHPTDNEGFGKVLIESMFVKTFPIASNTGGIPEILDNGKYGDLVEQNNIEQFAEKAVLRFKKINETMSMVEKSFKHVSNKYSVSEFKKRISKVLL